MNIDKKITLPYGTAHFKGSVTEEELDYIITLGLTTLLIQGEIPAMLVPENEPEFLTEDPDHGDTVH